MVNGKSSDTKFKYLLDFVTILLIHVAFSEMIKLSNILPIGFTIRFRHLNLLQLDSLQNINYY